MPTIQNGPSYGWQGEAIGINAHSYISPETAHEWQTWRRSLYQFAQLLFK